jgi:hypothetical protein
MLAIVLAAFAQPATSAVTGIPFAMTDSALFMEPLSSTALTIEQFNSSSLFNGHASSVAISFPLFSDDTASGPTEVASMSSNILPFGQVCLAFPSISQRTNDRLAYEQTYFFTDTFS